MPKRAFLIGCNYTATPSIQLSGCINDVINMRNTLIDAYGWQDSNIYTLRDDYSNRLPTKANIMYYLTQLIAMSSASDLLWVHYSGHGTQIKSTDSDEADNLDECIVPCDYTTSGVITDNELYAILKNAKCKVMLLLDSCHSGTGCDLQYSISYNGGAMTRSVNNMKKISGTNIVMISGCADSQTSADAYDNISKQSVGAFTQTLLETLRASDHTIDLLSLYSRLCVKLRAYGFTQIPVLSSSTPSPSFQFARANANGNGVSSSSLVVASTATKDFVLSGKVVAASPSTNVLRGLMSSLIGK